MFIVFYSNLNIFSFKNFMQNTFIDSDFVNIQYGGYNGHLSSTDST